MKKTAVVVGLSTLFVSVSSAATFGINDGVTSVSLDGALLGTIGWSVTGAANTVTPAAGFDVGFDILATSDFSYESDPFGINSGNIFHVGTVELTSDGSTVAAGAVSVGDFTIDSALSVIDTATTGAALFTASATLVDVSTPGELIVAGDLLVTDALSNVLVGNTSLTGVDAGNFQVAAVPEPSLTILAGGLAAFLVIMVRRRRAA